MRNRTSLCVEEKVIEAGKYNANPVVERIHLNKITKIGVAAFKDCESLKEVVLDEVTSLLIDYGAFDNCQNLQDVHFILYGDHPVVEISEDAFRNIHHPITFHIPQFGNRSLEEFAKKHHFRIEKFL